MRNQFFSFCLFIILIISLSSIIRVSPSISLNSNLSPSDCLPMINKNDNSPLDKANKINSELEKNYIDTIIDDTDENFSSKLKKMNLIGAPFQIIIGKQTDGDLIEFKEVGTETQKLKITEIIKIIKEKKEKN